MARTGSHPTQVNVGCSYSTAFIITLILAALKVTDVISVSWWVVTAPLWLSFAFTIVVGGFIAFIALCIAIGKAVLK